MNNQRNTFGFYLQARRSGKKTLRAFAADIGVTPGYISDIENDRRDPPGKELIDKMADVLSITGPELIMFSIWLAKAAWRYHQTFLTTS